MTELSPEARLLLGAARRGDDPLETDRRRLNQRMAQRLGTAAAIVVTGVGTVKTASGAGAISVLLGKGIVTGVILTAATIGAWKTAEKFVAHERHTVVALRTTEPTAATATQPMAGTSTETVTAATVGTDLTSIAEPLGVIPTNQPEKRQGFASPGPRREQPPANSESPTADPLAAEVAALREAQRSMAGGDPVRTLGLLTEQNARWKGGLLAQERAATRIFALCELHRAAEARLEAAAFERSWPQSPLILRVQRVCDVESSRHQR